MKINVSHDPVFPMLDPDRLARVHVVNVRGKDGKYLVVLSDDSTMSWEDFVTHGCEELRNTTKYQQQLHEVLGTVPAKKGKAQ